MSDLLRDIKASPIEIRRVSSKLIAFFYTGTPVSLRVSRVKSLHFLKHRINHKILYISIQQHKLYLMRSSQYVISWGPIPKPILPSDKHQVTKAK